jgi:hypothetical protein
LRGHPRVLRRVRGSVLGTEPVGLMQMKLIAMRDERRSALNKYILKICRDEHSRQLRVWLVAFERVFISSMVSSLSKPQFQLGLSALSVTSAEGEK